MGVADDVVILENLLICQKVQSRIGQLPPEQLLR